MKTFWQQSILCSIVVLTFSTKSIAQRDYFFRDSTVYPINTSIKYIAGKRALYKSESNTIALVKDFSVPGDTTIYIRDVDFVNANKGYVLVGSIYIGSLTQLYKTLDGGASWKLDTSFFPESERKSINQMQLLDSNTFVLFDGYYTSSLIRSFDGGQTWTKWFESLIAHYFQLHRCSNETYYLIGLPGDGFSSYSFPIPDSLWTKESLYFMSGCHNGAPGCIRVFRDGDRDRATDFIAKQIDTLTKMCGIKTSIENTKQGGPILIYPNPAQAYFVVENALGKTIQLYDVYGALAHSANMKSNKEIVLLAEMKTGFYFLLVDSFVYKIVIQH